MLILIRHGQSVRNITGFNEGPGNDFNAGLTELGTVQCHTAGLFLRDNFEIDEIYYSPSTRAVETCEILTEYITPKHCAVDPALVEVSNGIIDGRTRAYIKSTPELAEIEALLVKLEMVRNYAMPCESAADKILDEIAALTGGETTHQIRSRAMDIYDNYTEPQISALTPYIPTVLLVTHGDIIQAIISVVSGISKYALRPDYKDEDVLKTGCGPGNSPYNNCGITVINDGRIELLWG